MANIALGARAMAMVLISAPALAGMTPAAAQEPVVRDGIALAYEQIATGRLGVAEYVLAPRSERDARDPARLINLGVVYGRTGRVEEARAAFMAAREAPMESLISAGGRSISSRDLAQEGLEWIARLSQQ